MTVRVVIPYELLEEVDQHLPGQSDLRDIQDAWTYAVQMGEDLPANRSAILRDDFHTVPLYCVRKGAREWIEERNIDVRVKMAFYLDDPKMSYFCCSKEPGSPKNDLVYYSPHVVIEFQDANAAMLFKLTWGGQ